MHPLISQMLATGHIRDMQARTAEIQPASNATGSLRRCPSRDLVLLEPGQTLWKPMSRRWRQSKDGDPADAEGMSSASPGLDA
jgi:hypothetical protein